jgi:hypothetical protein
VRARVVSFVAAALAVASVWYVQAPPRTADAYGDRAAKAATTLRSQLEMARLWAAAAREEQALAASVSVGLEDSERAALRAASRFEAYDPPPDAAGVRTRFTALADEATAVLAELRIAAHREDWSGVAGADARLARLSRRLEAFGRAAER